MARKAVYRLAKGEGAILDRARHERNPNWVTNYYMRSAATGTYWREVLESDVKRLKLPEFVEAAQRWQSGYESLHEVWTALGKPEYFYPEDDKWYYAYQSDYNARSERLERIYRVFDDDETGKPVFHHPHGALMLPWQLDLYKARQPIDIIVGGFGCLGAESRILDLELGELSVEQLIEMDRAPIVLSMDGYGFSPVKASKVYKKGTSALYRVVFGSGKELVATMKHRFLTVLGWKTLGFLRDNHMLLIAMSESGEATLDTISSVTYLREGDFYDLHVPVYENYVAGGVVNHNSGKTIAKILHMMTRAVLLPGYRGFVLAPYSIQSMEVYTQALMMTSDTLFEERFILRAVTKPFPTLEIGHDGVGRNTIEFYPILDDPDKIRTLTGDEGMVDQIEKLPDIQNVIRVLGTRLRGQYQGRPRVGKITLIGNPDDNPEMWDLIDDADNDPDMLWAYRPATHENTYLTVADFIRFQKQVGEDEESQGMYLFGRKPKGGGKHFPAESIQRLHDESLDDYMKENLESGIPGFVRIERPKVGVHRWETPRLPDHEYLVIADPGWGNPPYRNSPVVGVWDITTFAFGGPARLVAFEWVFGNGSPNPWIAKYNEYVLNYHAIGNNAYDATGFQSVYQSLADTGLEGLLAEPINLGGQKKLSALNLAKKMMADGRFSAPNIPHMFSQLAKYDLPDNQLRQDIVSFILVTAQWLERLYYVDMSEGDDDPYDESDRAWREEESRYPGRTE